MYQHISVLLKEAIENLNLQKGDLAIDGTLGGGGHALEILKKISVTGKLIGFDLDQDAISECQQKFLVAGYKNVQLINDNFAKLGEYGKQFQLFSKVSGILLDLGISNYEIRDSGRGFSFQKLDEPLDLRFNASSTLTAQQILTSWPEAEIKRILKDYGEERMAAKIARRVCAFRQNQSIKTVADLLQIIKEVYPYQIKRSNPATKTWQALRIAVNDELASLEKFLPVALSMLKPGGRIAIITFHSLEDRIVKHFFKKEAQGCVCPTSYPVCQCQHQAIIKLINKKPITSTVRELEKNIQARSAKLRVIEKI